MDSFVESNQLDTINPTKRQALTEFVSFLGIVIFIINSWSYTAKKKDSKKNKNFFVKKIILIYLVVLSLCMIGNYRLDGGHDLIKTTATKQQL